MIHLDTSYLVDLLREASRDQDGPATALLGTFEDEELGVSVHVVCELHAGAAMSDDPGREKERVRSLVDPLAVAAPDESFAVTYGRLLATMRDRGETISTMDLLIATAAVADDVRLVTRNVRDFERVPGLHVVSY